MRFLTISLAALATCASTILAEDVKIEVTRAVECERKTQKGDKISVHYKGTLASDGSEFDASYKRGTPLSFVVGKGQVIKGWVLPGTGAIDADMYFADGIMAFWICASARREPLPSLLSMVTERETWVQSPRTAL
jgi:hypothetical protein